MKLVTQNKDPTTVTVLTNLSSDIWIIEQLRLIEQKMLKNKAKEHACEGQQTLLECPMTTSLIVFIMKSYLLTLWVTLVIQY